MNNSDSVKLIPLKKIHIKKFLSFKQLSLQKCEQRTLEDTVFGL